MWAALLLPLLVLQTPPPDGVKVADDRLCLFTDAGIIVIALYPEVAPVTVAQLQKLVRAGVYNGTAFVRIEKNFVMQLSAAESERYPPLSYDLSALLKPLPAEFSKLKHVRGVVSMAREDGKPDSAKTSFSILLGEAKHLDNQYTIVGHVEMGMDVVDELAKAPLTGKRPQKLLKVMADMISIEQIRAKPPQPAKQIFGDDVAGGGIDPRQLQSAIEQRAVLYSVGILLMMTCMLVTVFVPKVTIKQTQTLNLIAVLIGAFLLVATLMPMSMEFFKSGELVNAGHIIAIGIFFGLLGVFRLMSRFESAA